MRSTNKYLQIFFISIFALNFTLIHAQELDQESNYNALQHIYRLKKGTILVKLNTESKRIEAKEKYGNTSGAKDLKEKVKMEHEQIRSSFEEHFSFCNYKFFYSDDSKALIRQNDFSVLFPKEDAVPDNAPIYLLYLQAPYWYSSTDSYFFILYSYENGEVKKMESPFPFYKSTKSKKLFKRTDYNHSIQKLNNGFQNYFDKPIFKENGVERLLHPIINYFIISY